MSDSSIIPRKQRKQLERLLAEFDLTMGEVRSASHWVIEIVNRKDVRRKISVSKSPGDRKYLKNVRKDLTRKVREMR
jgi:hypothetical protein